MKVRAVLGSWGCIEKKLPTAISMQSFGVMLILMFLRSKITWNFFWKYPSVHTKKLRGIQMSKSLIRFVALRLKLHNNVDGHNLPSGENWVILFA